MKIITILMTVATITTVSGVLNSGLAMEGQGSSHSSSKKVERDDAGAPKRIIVGRTSWMLWPATAGGSQRTYYETEGPLGGRDAHKVDYHFSIESPASTISRIAGGRGFTIDFHTTIGDRHIRWTYNLQSSTLTSRPAASHDHKDARMTEREFDEWLKDMLPKNEAKALEFIQSWVEETRKK